MSVESKQSNVFTMYRGRLIKVGVLVFFSLLLMIVYVSFFQHPPPDELLENNRRSRLSSRQLDFGASLFGSKNDFDEESDNLESDDKNADNSDDELEDDTSVTDEDDEENKEDNEDERKSESEDEKELDRKVQKSHSGSKLHKTKAEMDVLNHQKRELGNPEEIENADFWEKFLKRENLVPIGAVYNKCEGHRTQLGTVVLMEDKENGGIKARTYVNITLEHTVDGGQFNIDSRYNGRGLYDNYWELCDVEDDLPEEEKTFVCPLKPGKYSRVKDKPIPGFLPKGRFQSKIWATDQNGKMIGCGYSDFTI